MIKKGEFNKKINQLPQLFRRQKENNITFLGVNSAALKAEILKYSRKLQEVVTYFTAYKSTSITLYRIRIWLDVDKNKQVSLDQFKQFFSELNKKATKPTVGFKGYLNFFYIWNKQDDQWFQDIVLIMDSATLFATNEENQEQIIRNITQEFKSYAYDLQEYRAGVIFENQIKPTIEVQSIPLMHHLDLPSQLLINVKDREMWKLFEEKILPYFISHEFVALSSDEEIRNRFSRGTKKLAQ